MLSILQSPGVILFLLMSSSVVVPARGQTGNDPWVDFRFLIGKWISDGKPEEGSGGFSLEPDLRERVLIRRNRLDMPAARGRPAGMHEDLMIVYRTPDGKQIKASYFDNEDHVIQYTVQSLKEKNLLVFVSDSVPSAPRFRLTYERRGQDTVAVRFEIAPPGKPEVFKTYLEGTAHRK
jgi:hypothetical protein